MPISRRAEAFWDENKNLWRIKVQKNGVRKDFTSSLPGRKGKHEAEAKADKWLESGTKEMRFDAAWAAYLDHIREHTGTGNYINHEKHGRLYILPIIGRKKLSSITPLDWQRCIDAAVERGLSRRTCVNVRGSITAFASYAKRARWEIQRIEDGDISIPNSATPAKEKRVLQPDDIRTLFESGTIDKRGKQEDCHYIHAWRFYVATGLRRGELCGLRCEDVVNGCLSVKRNINMFCEETHGKNDNARRQMVLPELAQQILADQQQMLASKGIVSPWLFPDEQGECANPASVYKRWTTYRKQHNISSSIHELRHTFVSINKVDMPIQLLKGIVGHSVSMDTIGVYGHTISGEQSRAASLVDAAFAEIFSHIENKVGE